MLKSLRRKLTLWFIGLFLVIYCLGGATTIFVFDSGLSAAIDDEIEALASEILPSIETNEGRPSLKSWATSAGHLKMPASIQLFDSSKKLHEAYGPIGINVLTSGPIISTIDREPISLRSNYEVLRKDKKIIGYLQIQISTAHRDKAIQQFIFTMLILSPFLAITVGLTGYLFSRQAVAPVAKTLDVLKRFVADAGHEFNTPVSVIEASVQTLEEMLKEQNMPTDVLEIIARASTRMKELAADLILLARIDSTEMELSKELLSVDEIIKPAVEEFIELARSKSVILNCSQIPESSIYGNAQSLKIMISNLLSNALKYTDAGGSVKIIVTQVENDLFITVEDTGIGIPNEHLEHIFERFYRVDKSRSRSAGGSGLGLSIVKAIIEVHSGTIKVESILDQGTKFIVGLPLAASPARYPAGKTGSV